MPVLGRQVGVATLPIVPGQTPVQIAKRAEEAARLQGFDVVLLDTAGRTHIDEPLMAEMAEIKAASNPHEILLVADALTGQDAVNLAKNFDERVGITGIVLTRADGDGRGGAALSMRAVTGKPIKLIGTGEKMDALDDFHPQRIANRILGMGDIVALVEKAAETIDADKAQRIAEKMRKGKFDLRGHGRATGAGRQARRARRNHGAAARMGKIKDALAAAKVDNKTIARQRAIILSMTPQERRNPDILKASRKKRIAAGSGMKVEEVNRLLKQHRTMADMMKSIGRRQARADGANGPDVWAGRRHAAADARTNRRTPAEIRAADAGMGLGIPSRAAAWRLRAEAWPPRPRPRRASGIGRQGERIARFGRPLEVSIRSGRRSEFSVALRRS